MPIPESIGQHYDVEPEDYWCDEYFQDDPAYFHHQIEMFARLTDRSPRGSSALDVGAGIGKAMVALTRAGLSPARPSRNRMTYELVGASSLR